MTRDEMVAAGILLNNGRKWGWQTRLAKDLGVDGSTVRRWVAGSEIPGPVAVAIELMVERKKDYRRIPPPGESPEEV